MSAYHMFTTSRTTKPDPVALTDAVRTATGDATAVIFFDGNTWRAKKSTTWSAGDISATQNALDTVAVDSPQKAAQRTIDSFPIEYRALILALVDAINVLRTHPAIGLPAVTPAQALSSIRAKAATLS